MESLQSLYRWSKDLSESEMELPVFFIGHGSPMNGIEDNEFSISWKKMGQEMMVPKAILVISAHWQTKGTYVTAMEHPSTIHDFQGFPESLFKVEYSALGSPKLATLVSQLSNSTPIGLDYSWGLDHGTWTVLRHMYPKANIPIVELSLDYYKSAQYHFDLSKQLVVLRKKGVLIIGSGNMVHNLKMIAWDKMNESEYGFDWAIEMNEIFKEKISIGDYKSLIDYSNLSSASMLAIPTPEHYFPLIYALALQKDKDEITYFNDKVLGGSLTMTSVRIG